MARQTPLLIAPTLEEVRLQASKAGLPQTEADKFYYYYESIGWVCGKCANRVKSWTSSLMGWKLRWEEKQRSPIPNGAMLVVWREELNRVLKKMDTIRGQYGDHQTWRESDCREWAKLKERKQQLHKNLGVVV